MLQLMTNVSSTVIAMPNMVTLLEHHNTPDMSLNMHSVDWYKHDSSFRMYAVNGTYWGWK